MARSQEEDGAPAASLAAETSELSLLRELLREARNVGLSERETQQPEARLLFLEQQSQTRAETKKLVRTRLVRLVAEDQQLRSGGGGATGSSATAARSSVAGSGSASDPDALKRRVHELSDTLRTAHHLGLDEQSREMQAALKILTGLEEERQAVVETQLRCVEELNAAVASCLPSRLEAAVSKARDAGVMPGKDFALRQAERLLTELRISSEVSSTTIDDDSAAAAAAAAASSRAGSAPTGGEPLLASGGPPPPPPRRSSQDIKASLAAAQCVVGIDMNMARKLHPEGPLRRVAPGVPSVADAARGPGAARVAEMGTGTVWTSRQHHHEPGGEGVHLPPLNSARGGGYHGAWQQGMVEPQSPPKPSSGLMLQYICPNCHCMRLVDSAELRQQSGLARCSLCRWEGRPGELTEARPLTREKGQLVPSLLANSLPFGASQEPREPSQPNLGLVRWWPFKRRRAPISG